MIESMEPLDQLDEEEETDKQLSMVDEALVAGTIANTNGLLVILAKLVREACSTTPTFRLSPTVTRSRSTMWECAKMNWSRKCRTRWS